MYEMAHNGYIHFFYDNVFMILKYHEYHNTYSGM